MTVINPNSVAGINSITVQSGNSLSVHKSDGTLIRTITESSGISTFTSISVGSATTTNNADKSINIGLGASISSHTDNTLSFGTRGDERARIDSSGRLIVGHTATIGENRSVQIVGTNADTSGMQLIRHSSDSAGAKLDLTKSRNATKGSNTIVQDDDSLGDIAFRADDGTDFNTEAARISAAIDGTPGANDIPGRLMFLTTADGANTPTERVRITSGGLVGIGTDTPGGVLEVFDTTSNTILNVKSGDAGAVLNLIDNNARSSIEQNGTDLKIISDTDAGDADSTIKLQVDGGTKMLIDSTGNVKVVSRGSSDSGAPFYVAVTGKSSIDYAGGSDDTANIRIKDEGSSNSYYHGIELRSKRDGDARIYAQDMGSDACDLVFATDNSGITEKLRITAAGRIGVNKSDPEAQVHVHKTNHYVLTNSGKAVHHIHTSGPNGNAGEYGGAISFAMGSTGAAAIAGLQGAADADNVGLAFITHNSGTGSADAVEMMRITSDGRIQANTQSQSDNEKYNFFFNGQADNQNCFTIRNDNSYDNVALIIKHGRGGLSGFSGKAVSFRGNDFTEEGSIVIGTTSVAYNTSSDYRLKENQVAISDGITRLKTLKPYRFNFKKDTGTTVDGFFAHEVTAVPEAVFGEKDAMKKIYYEEGDTLPSGKNVGDFKEFSSTEISAQSIDHSKLVPLLTAALQEAVTKIETLETKVAALEGG
jgi:hypothetical protein